MKTTIGFEFQTSDLSVSYMMSGQDVLYAEDAFRIDEIEKDLFVYGDRPTQMRGFYKDIEKEIKDREIMGFSFATSVSSKKIYVPTFSMENTMNDAEFVYTDATPRDTRIDGLYDHMYTSMRHVLRRVVSFLQRTRFHRIESVVEHVEGKRARNTILFPYTSFSVHEKSVCLLGREWPIDPSDIEFHVQCTVGIEVRHVRQVMCDFARDYIPYARHNELPFLLDVLDIDTTCPKELSSFEQTLFFMIVYFYRTFSKRKKAPFLIRHLFSNILKHVSQKVLDRVLPFLSDEIQQGMSLTHRSMTRTLYEKEFISADRALSPRSSARRMELKVFQDLDVSSTYTLDEFRPSTRVLVEFRYFHSFIMTRFFSQPAKKTTLLSSRMLPHSP